MKILEKPSLLKLFVVLLCMIKVSSSYATLDFGGFVDRADPLAGVTTGAPSTSAVALQPQQVAATCPEDKDDGHAIPMAVLTGITRGKPVKVEMGDDRQTIQITVPPYISNCMELDFVPTLDDDNRLFLKFVNNRFKTQKEYEDCMKDPSTGTYKQEGDPPKLVADISKVQNKIPLPRTFPLGSKFNARRSLQVYYSSPRTWMGDSGYKPVFGSVNNSPDPCFTSEHMRDEAPYTPYTSKRDMTIHHYRKICGTGTYRDIVGAISDLRSDTAGNARKLNSAQQQIVMALEAAREKRQKAEAKLLESDLKKYAKLIRGAKNQGTVTKYTRKYAETLEKLRETLLDPSLEEIISLSNLADRTVDEQKRLIALTTRVGKYHRNGAIMSKEFFANIEKYPKDLKDQYLQIREFQLDSKGYSKLNPEKSESENYTPEMIHEIIYDRIQEYKEDFHAKELEYRTEVEGCGEECTHVYEERLDTYYQFQNEILGQHQQRVAACQRSCQMGARGPVNPYGCTSCQRGLMASKAYTDERIDDLRYELDFGYNDGQLNKLYNLQRAYDENQFRLDANAAGSTFLDDDGFFRGGRRDRGRGRGRRGRDRHGRGRHGDRGYYPGSNDPWGRHDVLMRRGGRGNYWSNQYQQQGSSNYWSGSWGPFQGSAYNNYNSGSQYQYRQQSPWATPPYVPYGQGTHYGSPPPRHGGGQW
ncbi:MAG: hypothetical protein ISR65_04535 [Bacteriovoracaceae bacterium]|nr:hypothetical protein [Bacteriovoracaceae bacterium]